MKNIKKTAGKLSKCNGYAYVERKKTSFRIHLVRDMWTQPLRS